MRFKLAGTEARITCTVEGTTSSTVRGRTQGRTKPAAAIGAFISISTNVTKVYIVRQQYY